MQRKVRDFLSYFLCVGERELDALEAISKKAMPVEEVAKKLNISRSLAQRYLKSLVAMRLAERKRIKTERGKKFVYKSKPQKEIKRMLKESIRLWYKELMKQLK